MKDKWENTPNPPRSNRLNLAYRAGRRRIIRRIRYRISKLIRAVLHKFNRHTVNVPQDHAYASNHVEIANVRLPEPPQIEIVQNPMTIPNENEGMDQISNNVNNRTSTGSKNPDKFFSSDSGFSDSSSDWIDLRSDDLKKNRQPSESNESNDLIHNQENIPPKDGVDSDEGFKMPSPEYFEPNVDYDEMYSPSTDERLYEFILEFINDSNAGDKRNNENEDAKKDENGSEKKESKKE